MNSKLSWFMACFLNSKSSIDGWNANNLKSDMEDGNLSGVPTASHVMLHTCSFMWLWTDQHKQILSLQGQNMFHEKKTLEGATESSKTRYLPIRFPLRNESQPNDRTATVRSGFVPPGWSWRRYPASDGSDGSAGVQDQDDPCRPRW